MDDRLDSMDQINHYIDHEKIIFLCYDYENQFNGMIKDFLSQLRHVNDDIVCYTELQSCLTFLATNCMKKIFLITCDTSVLSHIKTMNNISIFVFKAHHSEYSFLDDSRIIGIYHQFDLLCSSIEDHMHFGEDRLDHWAYFDDNDVGDLCKQPINFLWLHLLRDVLPHMAHDDKAYNQMNDTFPFDNDETNYKSNEAISWFLNNSSFQSMINTAFRREDTEQLYRLRYFLKDFFENLSREHQQIVQSDETKLFVYRTMQISNSECQKIKKHKGKLITLKGFLTATRIRPSIESDSTRRNDSIPVLFEISGNIQELNNNMIFADISQFNKIESGGDILFDIGTTFRLDKIEEDKQKWFVQMTVVSSGQTLKQKYLDDTRRQIENLSVAIIFGRLICDMGRWGQSKQYLEHLMNDSHDEDMAWIQYSFGEIYQWKREWIEARNCYDRAYNQMIQTKPARIKESVIVLCSINEILYYQGKYEECYKFTQQALTIQEKYYPRNHPYTANLLETICCIRNAQMKIDEALFLAEQILAIRKQYYKCDHIDIFTSVLNIGISKYLQGKIEEALDHLQRALAICKKHYPFDHINTALSLCLICNILTAQEKYDEALQIIRRALTIQRKYYSSGNFDIAISVACIGDIKRQQKKYDEALDLYQQCLTIQTKSYSGDHLEITYTLNKIALTLQREAKNFDKAIMFHQKALSILEVSYPSYYGSIAQTLIFIGQNLQNQGKLDQALTKYKRALKMQEDYYTSKTNIEIANSLGNIGSVLYKLEKYDEAINSYEQCLTLYKKHCSIKHVKIPQLLIGIGHIKYSQRNFLGAFLCFSELVCILKEHHPTNHMDTGNSFARMADVFIEERSYDYAVVELIKCLQIREICHLSEQSTIIATLTRISELQVCQHQYELSLAYEMKCFSIREKSLPPDHEDIGSSLSNIGYCYEKLNKNNLALEYYKRAFNIYRQCLPESDSKRQQVISNIQRLLQLTNS